MVGMSKSGSRYGRRSNWFKIHCLLQEQQQQAAAAAAAGHRKTPPQSSAMNMLNHPTAYPPGLYPRPPCTKEELMLLGFDEYSQAVKHSSASPSVSSPDSHNSDSSVEIGDRRQSLLRQTQAPSSRDQLPGPQSSAAAAAAAAAAFNKELFLPLPFSGLMPPPGFLPPTHLMFSGYHPALYAQHQGLLKPAIDPAILLNSTHNLGNNNNRFAPNHNSKSAEELTKRYLDAVLNSQRSPGTATIKSDDEDMESEDVVVSMTPPRSPPSARACSTISARDTKANHVIGGVGITNASEGSPRATTTSVHQQEIPIDLSMKTGSCTSADDVRLFSGNDSDDISDDDHDNGARRSLSVASNERFLKNGISCIADDDEEKFDVKRTQIGTIPLDLTTKI